PWGVDGAIASLPPLLSLECPVRATPPHLEDVVEPAGGDELPVGRDGDGVDECGVGLHRGGRGGDGGQERGQSRGEEDESQEGHESASGWVVSAGVPAAIVRAGAAAARGFPESPLPRLDKVVDTESR